MKKSMMKNLISSSLHSANTTKTRHSFPRIGGEQQQQQQQQQSRSGGRGGGRQQRRQSEKIILTHHFSNNEDVDDQQQQYADVKKPRLSSPEILLLSSGGFEELLAADNVDLLGDSFSTLPTLSTQPLSLVSNIFDASSSLAASNNDPTALNTTNKSSDDETDLKDNKQGNDSASTNLNYYSVGRDFYDDGYYNSNSDDCDDDVDDSENHDEAEIEDKLDFSDLKVKGRQKELQVLHKIYHHVSTSSSSSSSSQHSRSQHSRSTSLRRRRQNSLRTSSRKDDSNTTIAIVKGSSGTGKSRLVKQFLDDLDHTRKGRKKGGGSGGGHVGVKTTKPYILCGKYDELSGGDPFSAIVEAYNMFTQTLLQEEDPNELQRIQTLINDTLGEEANVLATVIPNLQKVIKNNNKSHKATSTPSSSSSSSQNSKTDNEDSSDTLRNSDADDYTNTNNNLTVNDTTHTRSIDIVNNTNNNASTHTRSKENAWNRLKYIFQIFCNVISTKERPAIMFLDDLQWCDTESLQLIETLLTDKDLQYFMFVGSYRSDEMQDDDELITRLKTIDQTQSVQYIELTNFTLNELNDFVAHALKIERDDVDEMERIMTLTQVVHDKTSGNVLHAIQVLEELQRKGILYFSRMTFIWEWNIDETTNLDDLLSDDVIAAITSKILNAPELLQQVLIHAAYTRSTVDIHTIRQLLKLDGKYNEEELDDKLVNILDKAVVDGFLTNTIGSQCYSFAHDRIQQASYGLIPSGRTRDEFRQTMGHRLYEIGSSEAGEDWMLFAAVDHLNATAYTNRKQQEDPMFLTRINVEAGERAASVFSFEIASKFLGLGMQSFRQNVNDPWMDQYDMALNLYQATVDVELCQGNFDHGYQLGCQVLQNARTLEDKLPTQVSLVKALGRHKKNEDSFNMGTQALQTLGHLPASPMRQKFMIMKDLMYVDHWLSSHSDDDILARPFLEDPKLLLVLELILNTAYQAKNCGKNVEFLACVLRGLRITAESGLCGYSGSAMMGYCIFRDKLNDVNGVERCSHLAHKILDVTKANDLKSLQLFLVGQFISSWKDPHNEVIKIFEQGYKFGMESGDFVNGLVCRSSSYYYQYLAGYPLAQIDILFANHMQKTNGYKVDFVANSTAELWLVTQYLRGTAGRALDFDEISELEYKSMYQYLYGCLSRLQLGVYYGDYEFAEKFLTEAATVAHFSSSPTTVCLRLFFGSLVCFHSCPRTEQSLKYQESTQAISRTKIPVQVEGNEALASVCIGTSSSTFIIRWLGNEADSHSSLV